MRSIKVIIPIAFLLITMAFTQPENTNKNQKNDEIKWYTIEQVEELVKNEPKKIFIDVYTDWCGYCKVMDRETFTNPEVIELLNRDFYAVKLDAEGQDEITFKEHTYKFVAQGRKGYHELAAAFLNGKMSYPTTVYLDEELKPITMVPGYLKPEQIKPILNYFGKDHYKTQSWEEYNKN
ncbi:MAG: thioredoxin family protein [Cyclobacteriaceae bacterium]